MAGTRGLFILPDGSSNGTTPLNARLALGALVAWDGGSGITARPGVFYDQGGAVVTGTTDTGTMTYSIRACRVALYLTGVASSGIVVGSNDAVLKVNTTAAPGSNSRIDVVWCRQHAVASDGGPDTDNIMQFGVTQGTAAASPTVPAIPTGAMALANFTMPSGTTQTSGLTATQVHNWTTSNGSPVPVRNSTERTALSAQAGMTAYQLDTDAFYRYSSTGFWEREASQQPPLANGHKPRRILTRTTTFTVNDSTLQTIGGWAAAGAGGDDGDTTGIVLSSSGGTTNLLTFTKGGLYRVTFCLQFNANATGIRQVSIWKNPTFSGTTVTGGTRVNSKTDTGSAAGVQATLIYAEVIAADGDTLTVVGFQTSGAGLTAGSTTDGSVYWHVVRDDD